MTAKVRYESIRGEICELWFNGEYWEVDFKDTDTDEHIRFETFNKKEEMIERLKNWLFEQDKRK